MRGGCVPLPGPNLRGGCVPLPGPNLRGGCVPLPGPNLRGGCVPLPGPKFFIVKLLKANVFDTSSVSFFAIGVSRFWTNIGQISDNLCNNLLSYCNLSINKMWDQQRDIIRHISIINKRKIAVYWLDNYA